MSQSRRKFIKIFGSALGLIALGKLNLFGENKFGSLIMKTKNLGQSSYKSEKILVVYESQFGSTAEVAEYIGENLRKSGRQVSVKKIEDASKIFGFDKVILGSAIQYDNWMPNARNFVIENKAALSKISVAFFFTCLVLSKKTEKSEQKAETYAEKLKLLAQEVKPISIGKFAGKLDYKKMNVVQRTFAKGIFAVLGVKSGDYRNWQKIKQWTLSLKF